MPTMSRSRVPLWVECAALMAIADALLVSWRLQDGWLAAGCLAALIVGVVLCQGLFRRPAR